MRFAILALTILPVFAADPAGPEYTPDGRLKFPEHYREWVFLSTGIGMTYGPIAAQAQWGPPLFDNIYVNPEAYRAFLKTGRWPDKTILVMEARYSESHASINNGGHFQTDLAGVEAEVKDSSTPEGPWNFYGFTIKPGQPVEAARAVSRKSGCFGCHSVKTAVENTFVQFYPPLYDAAERMGTFNPGFEPLPVTPAKLIDRILTSGWRKTVPALDDSAKRAPDSTIMNVEILNQQAYRLMNLDVVGDAMSLLEWASASYPKSANIQDSLAEASEKFGNPWLARTATERALKLLPDDTALPPARRDRISKGADERLKRLPPPRTGPWGPPMEMHGGLPSVSPDGTRIALLSDRGGSPAIYVVSADGGEATRITEDSTPASAPSWDATGHVLYSRWAEGQSRLYAVNADGKDQRVVGTFPARSPMLSPDGKSVLYADRRIYLSDLEDVRAAPLTTGVAMEFGPAWSPDAGRIAFTRSGPDRLLNIWVMNADGREQRQLSHIPAAEGQAEWAAWSPDGRRIAVQVSQYTSPPGVSHIWVIDAASGEARKLAPHAEAYLDETPSWFPDGKRLAFQSNRTGRMEVWVVNADGTGARQLTR